MVCALARAAGEAPSCESVAKPDYSLEDHWNERDARQRHRARLGRRRVAARAVGAAGIARAARRLCEAFRCGDSKGRRADRALHGLALAHAARRSSTASASRTAPPRQAVGGLLLPAGDAWRAAWAIDPCTDALWSGRFAPVANRARYLASLVIYPADFQRAGAGVATWPA